MLTENIVHLPTVKDWRERIEKTKDIITSLNLPLQSKILDIGGHEYDDYCKKHNFQYSMIDLKVPLKNDSGWHGKKKGCFLYDGRNLPFEPMTFDLILICFVFHHASHNTLFLLKQIRNITKRYIIVGEDITELFYPIEWHKRNFEHQLGGLFRSDEEWKILFDLFGFKLIKQYIIRQYDEEPIFVKSPNTIYRSLYLLEKR